jgi:tRNA(adenine34) deaminase
MSEEKTFPLPPMEIIQGADEYFMREALKEAQKAFLEGEVPVGAVVVFDGKIIARGYNQVELLRDATAHAEMIALTIAESALGNWRLSECTLYSTLEPCPMCLGALLLTRVSVLVWGAQDLRHGACGSWVNLFEKPHPTHTMTVREGVLRAFCQEPLRRFFKQRREEE